MNIRNLAGALGVSIVAIATLGLGPQERMAAPSRDSKGGAESFNVDPVHTSVVFKIRHMGVSNFYGRFDETTGTYSIDPSGSTSKFDFQVKTASFDSNNKQRDDDLKGPDFFNAAEFPTISFKTSSVSKSSDNKLSVTGDLTMHGVTKPLTAELTWTPGKQTPKGYRSGFETNFTVKRTDFKMDKYVAEGGLGDEVLVTVSVEGVVPKTR